jgi:hypothetical protein
MLQERDGEVPNPKPHNFQGNPNLQYSNQYCTITWYLAFEICLELGIWDFELINGLRA